MTEESLRSASFVISDQLAPHFERGLDMLSEAGTIYERSRIEPENPVKGAVVISVRGARLDPAMELQAGLTNTNGNLDSDRVADITGEIIAAHRLNQENPRMARATASYRQVQS